MGKKEITNFQVIFNPIGEDTLRFFIVSLTRSFPSISLIVSYWIKEHGCINMKSTKNVVTCSKDYGTSKSNQGKEPAAPEIPLRIEKPSDNLEASPRIPKGVLKHSGHNLNSRAA